MLIHRLRVALLGVGLFTALLPRADAATITMLERNPVLEHCLLDGTLVAGAPFTVRPRGECANVGQPQKERPDYPEGDYTPDNSFWDGSLAPRALGLYSGMFVADGGRDYLETHFTAAWTSLREGKVFRIEGEIKKGDLERLKQVLSTNNGNRCAAPGYCPNNNVISLNSPGGNLAEALRIAQYIRDHQFVTLLEPGARCESSCSFLFFSGYTEYGGFHFPRRFADITARIGVHRPSLQVRDADYSAQDIAKAAQLINTVLSNAMQTYIDAGIGLDVLKQMYDTPSETMSYLTTDQLAANAVVLGRDIEHVPTVSRARVLRHCLSEYAKIGTGAPPALLENLHVGPDSFITFEDYGDFYCAGVRMEDDGWHVESCVGQEDCALSTCDEAWYETGAICPDLSLDHADGDYTILVSYGSLNLGLAILHPSNLLDFVARALRNHHEVDYAEWKELSYLPFWTDFSYLMKSSDTPATPYGYCGLIDFRDPEIATELQAALTAAGFDAGPADGILGRRTQVAVWEASKALLGAEDTRPSAPLLRALGFSETDVAAMRLCNQTQ